MSKQDFLPPPAPTVSGGIVFLVAFALWSTGLLTPGSKTEPSPDKGASSGTRSANSKSDHPRPPTIDEEIVKPVFEFFGISAKDNASRIAALQQFQKADETPWTIEPMIACIPDPLTAAIGYLFDPFLESLQQGLSTEGFVLDKHTIPWQEDKRRLVAAEKAEKLPERIHRQMPGVLLFRDERNRRLLLVFLVGDNPMSGIHVEAFRNAVNAITKTLPQTKVVNFLGGKKQPVSPNAFRLISVLGPFFSGSSESLGIALDNAHAAFRDGDNSQIHGNKGSRTLAFRVISGSATNIDQVELEKSTARSGDPRSLFFATTAHINLVRDQLIRTALAMRAHQSGPARIAWLQESTTGFGARNTDEMKENSYVLQQFPFPLHISQIRQIFIKEKGNSPANVPTLGRERYLPKIPFEENAFAEDVLPQFAPEMNAATAMITLTQTLEIIHRDRYEYIGIRASDVRDKIFLAGLIKEYCPDAQLLISEGELLLTHTGYRSFLKGTLAANSYPMIQNNQYWMQERDDDRSGRIQFSSEAMQGVYNAAILLLHFDELLNTNELTALSTAGKKDPLTHKTKALKHDRSVLKWTDGWQPMKPDQKTRLLEYGTPPSLSRPPADDSKNRCRVSLGRQPAVWVTVIGNDGFLPLKATPLDEAAEIYSGNQSPNGASEDLETLATMNAYTFPLKKVLPAKSDASSTPPSITEDMLQLTGADRLVFTLAMALVTVIVFRRLKCPAAYQPHFAALCTTMFAFLLMLLLVYLGSIPISMGSHNASVSTSQNSLSECACGAVTLLSWIVGLLLFGWALSHPDVRSRDESMTQPPPREPRALSRNVLRNAFILGTATIVVSELFSLNQPFSHWTILFDRLLFDASVTIATAVFLTQLYIVLLVAAPELHDSWTGVETIAAIDANDASAKLTFKVRIPVTILGLFSVAVSVCGMIVTWSGLSTIDDVFFFERHAHVLSGASLVFSLIGISGGLSLWTTVRSEQIHLGRLDKMQAPVESDDVPPPWPTDVHETERIERVYKKITGLFRNPIAQLCDEHIIAFFIVVFGAMSWTCLLFLAKASSMLDGYFWSSVFWVGVALLWNLWLFWFYQAVIYTKDLGQLFQELSLLPFSKAFKRLPNRAGELLQRSIYIRGVVKADWEISERYAKLLQQHVRSSPKTISSHVKTSIKSIFQLTRGRRRAQIQPVTEADRQLASVQKNAKLVHLAQGLWQGLLQVWQERDPRRSWARFADTKFPDKKLSKAASEWVARAEDLISVQIFLFCNPLLRHAKKMIALLIIPMTLAFGLAVTSYVPSARGMLVTTLFWTIVAGTVLGIVGTFRAEHDALLSLVEKSSPAHVTFDRTFFSRISLSSLGLIVLLLSNLLPQSSDWLKSLFEPLLQALS